MAETAADLMIDGTERRRQRPKDAKKQEQHDSGKKKTHTDKHLVWVNNQSKKVLYLSPTVGVKPTTRRWQTKIPSTMHYSVGATLGKDTGFQGYEPAGVTTFQPKKAEGERIEPGRPMVKQYYFGCVGCG